MSRVPWQPALHLIEHNTACSSHDHFLQAYNVHFTTLPDPWLRTFFFEFPSLAIRPFLRFFPTSTFLPLLHLRLGKMTLGLPYDSTCTADHEKPDVAQTEPLRIALIWVFNSFQIFGAVSVSGVMLTVLLSRRIKRAPSWYIFMTGWIVWCISFSLLSGQQTSGCPPFLFCLFQAALIYAITPAMAAATFGILMELYFMLTTLLDYNVRVRDIVLTLIYSAPPFLFLFVLIEVVGYGVLNADHVRRDSTGMYCSVSDGLPAQINSVLVGLFSVAMLVYEAKTISLLYRKWTTFNQKKVDFVEGDVSIATIVRVYGFSMLPILALALSVASAIISNNTVAHLFTATTSGAAGIIFGTQRDIREALMFWRTRKTERKAYVTKELPIRSDDIYNSV